MKFIGIYKIPKNKNLYFLILVVLIDYITSNFSFKLINNLYPNFAEDNTIFKVSPPLLFVFAIIIIPILETVVFQFVIIEVLLKIKTNEYLALIISTIIFSLLHNYNTGYILYIILCSWIFPLYYLALRSQSIFIRIFLVALVHAISNFTAYYI